ncbi:MAG: hypothetical protein WC307_05965 [Candidatus Nanoarchaeia archaeon]|jgi:hypothetical protein
MNKQTKILRCLSKRMMNEQSNYIALNTTDVTITNMLLQRLEKLQARFVEVIKGVDTV